MKAKKIATKKTVTKSKLIEGKYSHKFLTRLTPQDGKNFETIKKKLGEKTYNGTIMNLISMYFRLEHNLDMCHKTISELELKIDKQQRAVDVLADLSEVMKDFK